MLTTALALAAATGPAISHSGSDKPVSNGAPGVAQHGASQGHGTGHSSDHAAAPTQEGHGAAAKAFAEANARMHAGMAIVYSGDADVDFVRGMIGHHRGAVDMARIVLEHGNDPEIRQLASDIIKAQESEIAKMQDWLKRRGK